MIKQTENRMKAYIKTATLYLIILICHIISLKADDGLIFKPLTANPYEGRIGAIGDFKDKRLRLDIGASFDIIKFDLGKNNAGIGADFFTYTRLRSEGNMKFPVETSDYYFGFNYSMNMNLISDKSALRVRLAHISSHLVDGYADQNIFKKSPFVYSREFLDVTIADYYKDLRYYLGVNYVFSTKPKDPNPLIPQIGFDYNLKISPWLALTCGYDFKLVGIDGVYQAQNSLQAGITIYTRSHYGLFAGCYYYSGRSIHGEFYRDRDQYFGLGFQVVYW